MSDGWMEQKYKVVIFGTDQTITSVGQQCWGLEEAQAVIRPLKRGLYSFISISEMLLTVNADIIFPDCQTYYDIRQQIVNLKEQLEESEQVASQELQHLNWETERLTAKQSDLAEQKKTKEREAAVLTIGGAVEMDQTTDAVRRAKREVDSCSSQVRSYSDKVSDCSSSISKAQRDIRETDSKIHETNAKLQDMSVRRRLAADLQSKLRHTVHQLGLLYGVGSVTEFHTRRLIMRKPVMELMEEMTTVLSQVFRSELLHAEGLSSLMWHMRVNLDQLNALTDTSQPFSDYY
ncbi:hypothetical protein INR49_027540 [Caranx melampygus]|nr:hypothetical protein INR49_027540 [Caranx melampygus]